MRSPNTPRPDIGQLTIELSHDELQQALTSEIDRLLGRSVPVEPFLDVWVAMVREANKDLDRVRDPDLIGDVEMKYVAKVADIQKKVDYIDQLVKLCLNEGSAQPTENAEAQFEAQSKQRLASLKASAAGNPELEELYERQEKLAQAGETARQNLRDLGRIMRQAADPMLRLSGDVAKFELHQSVRAANRVKWNGTVRGIVQQPWTLVITVAVVTALLNWLVRVAALNGVLAMLTPNEPSALTVLALQSCLFIVALGIVTIARKPFQQRINKFVNQRARLRLRTFMRQVLLSQMVLEKVTRQLETSMRGYRGLRQKPLP